MSRVFAYCRVSTSDQTTENQIIAIRQAGYDVPKARVITETISGGVMAMERPAFKAMVQHKLEAGDVLVVLKLDRLGRDNIDVQQTIQSLISKGIGVISLDLGKHDLSSSEGKLMLQIFSAFAEFEKSRIKERTMAGLERAKSEGKTLGRKTVIDLAKLQQLKAIGLSQSAVSKNLDVSLTTVKRYWNK
ncbi:recombinase family protein [Azomonas macrocytogenes]|uniref:DNA invertase Pin-like site-specific DNA recombinase n=1 Tax=Azomonas macrocytogenes TaxID=69962 RepID=A0A839T4M8_AZOMA|nr:recombinase family protein [Azomonas macrocytogenes]MBB3104392.1 DNA invertase Pin-like site-specific DNA recombinase [Azomonas macrocytogenes]